MLQLNPSYAQKRGFVGKKLYKSFTWKNARHTKILLKETDAVYDFNFLYEYNGKN